jgi:hypothetical protein
VRVLASTLISVDLDDALIGALLGALAGVEGGN